MISRVADHCFWLGRYLERSESTARVLSVTRSLALDAELSPSQCWLPVVIIAGEQKPFEERFGHSGSEDGEVVQDYFTWASENLSSLIRSVGAARENTRSIREVVSLEVWEAVNELHLWITSSGGKAEYEQNRHSFYARVRQSIQLCLGLVRSTMLHDTPMDFIWLGAMLERGGQTARMLDVHYHALTFLTNRHQVVETSLWLSLLRACSGSEAFLKRHRGRVFPHAVASFLLGEEQFPRSVRYSVNAAYRSLARIRPPHERDLPGGRSLERLHVLGNWLDKRVDESIEPESLHRALTHVVDETAAICDSIGRELLGYPEPGSAAGARSSQ